MTRLKITVCVGNLVVINHLETPSISISELQYDLMPFFLKENKF